MTDIFIHVGLQKTGTTFIQEKVFKNIDVNYIRYVDRELYHSSFDDSKPLLISNEDLCGSPHAIFDETLKNNREHIARNLSILFPNAKIILGLREPCAWLKSLYREAVRQGLYLSYNKFYDMFDKEMLNFDRYIKLLRTLFHNVFIYSYEDLKKDYWSVIYSLCGFIGVQVPTIVENKLINQSLRSWQLPGFRLVNHFLYSKDSNPYGVIPHIWFGYIYNKIRGDGLQ